MQERNKTVNQLQEQTYDLLIIGGGITGAGIALDAASRGIKTALIEKSDFASGTSSRSTKLIHGGLRYLQNLEFKLVHEVGKERSLIHRLAPHLAAPEKMLLPLTKNGKYGKIDSTFGLWFYDMLAAVPASYRKKMLNKSSALKQEPLLPENKTLGAGLYTEFRTDDARLTIEVMKTAARKGATCLNYCLHNDFIYSKDQIVGVQAIDQITGNTFLIQSKVIVNATGPWVDRVRAKTETIQGKKLHLTKGIHIVVRHDDLPIRQSVYFDVPDGRMVFAIPRLNCTYIGTTDTDYYEDPDDVTVDQEDIQYLIESVNSVFPQITIKPEQVISAWAGLRPLINEPGKSASEISRKDEIFRSSSGLISIAGGKLTGYRVMAKKTVNLVAQVLKKNHNISSSRSFTHKIPLCASPFTDYQEVINYEKSIKEKLNGWFSDPSYTARYLTSNYGKISEIILEGCNKEDSDPELSLLLSEANYALNEEWCMGLIDFYDRRTARIYFDPGSISNYAQNMADHFSQVLRWSPDQKKNELTNLLNHSFVK